MSFILNNRVRKLLFLIRRPSIRLEKTSVLFVSVAFMMLMIASLAWLVFYYIQKFRMARSQILREVSDEHFCLINVIFDSLKIELIKLGFFEDVNL